MRDHEHSPVAEEVRSATHSRDLARISSTLLAALIALMTFLLIVGVQTRVTGFTGELYTAIVLLGASLVLFSVGSIVSGIGALTPLRAIRGLHQLVFIAGVIATVWFVISYAQKVVKPPETQQPGAQQQGAAQPQPGQPAAQQGGAGGPAPGETAEQHAAEAAKQQGAAQPQPGQ